MFRLARGLWPYRREWLAKDVVAGVVLSTLLVPQGMAYAELAGLPPITGLYTSILCLLGSVSREVLAEADVPVAVVGHAGG